MIEEAPDPMALALSPTDNSMVAVYGADARGRRCASCESYDYRARVCRIKGLRLPHKGSHAACARYRGRD